MGRENGKEQGCIQPSLDGMEGLRPEETNFDNCLVLSRPEYTDSGKKQEWTCLLHAEPSIFQPDVDMEVVASATHQLATLSQRKNLKPGDRVVLTGILREETLSFLTGETKILHRLALTKEPQVVKKEKRVSTTVYEQRRRRAQ